MARALGRGILSKNTPTLKVLVIDPQQEALRAWEGTGVSTQTDINRALSSSKAWVFAVKPQQMRGVTELCKPYLQKDTLLISIVAGLTTKYLIQWLGHEQLIRTMPNTPALIGKGITGLYACPHVKASEVLWARQILEAVGRVVVVEKEEQLEAITALSGSGPAYIFLLIEALMTGGIRLGLSEQEAKVLAIQTVIGAGELAAQSDIEPAMLRQNVTSKGGTTAAALAVYQEYHFSDIVGKAMQAAFDRAIGLAKELGE